MCIYIYIYIYIYIHIYIYICIYTYIHMLRAGKRERLWLWEREREEEARSGAGTAVLCCVVPGRAVRCGAVRCRAGPDVSCCACHVVSHYCTTNKILTDSKHVVEQKTHRLTAITLSRYPTVQRVYIYMYIYIYIHTCIYIYICAYIYIYT